LIAQGYCTRIERRGVLVPMDVLRSPALQSDQDRIHQRFLDMVDAMSKLDLVLPLAGDAKIAPTPQAVRRIETDFLLSLLEIALLPADWDMVQLTLLVALVALNIRHITYDAEVTWRYAYPDTPPPVELYKPVSVRRLSEEVAIPYETARQCVRRLIDRGQVDRVPGGLIVKHAWINGNGQQEMQQAFMGRFVRAMTALARIGVEFEDQAAAL
jgi:hypothetical protein